MDSRQVTVLIPTSAIPSHPDTTIMDETIAGLRHHLPDAKIVILADGIWSKLEHRRAQYEEYLKIIEKKYSNTVLVRFPQHTQQTAMAQFAFQSNYVQTGLVFWNEHDAPLRTDRTIDWDGIADEVKSGNAGLVRFTYFDEGIHVEHEHLTRGRYQRNGVTYVKTTQFSGWSFMTTAHYFVHKIFTGQPVGKEMLELRMYGPVANSPWEEYKVVIYCPDSPAQRFRHSNGRGFGVEERDPCDWG